MILISACLCGANCKYSGGNNFNPKAYELFKNGYAIPICPELLGGMSKPRPPHEIINGNGEKVLAGCSHVMSKDGMDSTENFIMGAEKALEIVKCINPEYIVLKSNSPSCGYGMIYNGSFNGEKIKGNGVTAQLLHDNGYKILTENDL